MIEIKVSIMETETHNEPIYSETIIVRSIHDIEFNLKLTRAIDVYLDGAYGAMLSGITVAAHITVPKEGKDE